MAHTGEPVGKAPAPDYTNVLPLATDAEGNIYNGTGWKSGYYLSSGNEGAKSGAYVTGFIPCKIYDQFYMQDVGFVKDDTAISRISAYDANKNHICTINGKSVQGYSGTGNWDYDSSTSYITKFKITASYKSDTIAATNVAYIRLSCKELSANSIITINEEIKETEAEDPSEPQPLFRFAFLSDMHCGYYTDTENNAVKDAGLGLGEVQKAMHLDTIILGGDYSTGAISSTMDSTYEDIKNCKALIKPYLGSTPAIWLKGNHDDAPYKRTVNRITKYGFFARVGDETMAVPGVVVDQAAPQGAYGYVDYPQQKIRLIYLNTNDKDGFQNADATSSSETDYLNAHNIGLTQLNWFKNTALNLTDKANESEWGIIVASHSPLNLSGSYTYNNVNYEYSTANAVTAMEAYAGSAKILFCINGHTHRLNSGVYGLIPFIEVPNVMNGRERLSQDFQTYSKTARTATSTAFSIITVDRANKKVYSTHYGAGYDFDIDLK